ncbi:MAG: methyltransferase domain-containing protein [Myxococcota bacterium]
MPTLSRKRRADNQRLLALGTSDHYEDAALYDFEYADRMDDVRWYRRIARERAGGGAILELGAGTGRITCRLAEDHRRIIALDRMQPMLDALSRRAHDAKVADRIEPVLGEMTDLPCKDASMQLVIVPFNGLMHLYTWDELLACFKEAHRVLSPGGVLAFDVELPDLEWLTWDPEERHAITRFIHPTTGAKLVYSTNHTYDAQTQICHVRIYYDDAPAAGQRFAPPAKPRKLVHLAHRQIFPEEIRCLVAQAGLSLESLTGDFLSISLRRGVQSQVAVCVREL